MLYIRVEMAKKQSTPFTEQDLISRGFRNDGSGVFHFVGHTIKDFVDAGSAMEKAMKKLPSATNLIPTPKKRPEGLLAIERVLIANRIEFVNEHEFSDKRKFRFDVAVVSMKLAIEYEGIFSNENGQNGHTGIKAYVKDCDKYNLATVEGWKVLRYTAKNYKNFLQDLTQLLTSNK
jgi:hypothetical protein